MWNQGSDDEEVEGLSDANKAPKVTGIVPMKAFVEEHQVDI